MAKQKYIRTEYNDGNVVLSNIRKGRASIPVIGLNDSYTATKVNTWFDGSPMTPEKADGSVYLQLSETGEYFKVNLPNDGELFLEKDTVAQLRDMSAVEILLLRMGYYKGVTLNGYYNANDTPAPIQYYLSDTTESDDGGSVFEVGGVKLEYILKTSCNIKYFGVFGGVVDMARINQVFKILTEKGLVIIADSDEYLIDATYNNNRSISLLTNMKLLNGDNTYYKILPNTSSSYRGFTAISVNNIYVNNIKIIGERDEHLGTEGEWGMGLALYNTSDLTVDFIEARDMWGDGIYIGKLNLGDKCENIYLKEVLLDNNRRQGISVISVDGFYIDKGIIKNTNGTAPELGIDFEPNHQEDTLSNIYVNNIKTENNAGGGIGLISLAMTSNSPDVHINISNHTSSQEGGLSFQGTRASRVKGNVYIKNYKSYNSTGSGILIRNYSNNPDLLIEDATIIDPIMRSGSGDRWQSAITIFRDRPVEEEVYSPKINLIRPKVIANSPDVLRGIVSDSYDSSYVMDGVFIDSPIIEGSALPIRIGGHTKVLPLNNIYTTMEGSSDSIINVLSYYTRYTNKNATGISSVRIGESGFKSRTFNAIRLEVEAAHNFRLQLSGGAYVRQFGEDVSIISSNVVGSYIDIKLIDYENQIYDIIDIVGIWTGGGIGLSGASPIPASQDVVNAGINNILTVTPLTLSGRTATTTRTGLVNQSTAVANITTPDATDEQTTMDLVNELKEKINELLSSDRASGQRAT